MGLAVEVTQEQFDALPEAVRPLYVQAGAGRYTLDIDRDQAEAVFAKPLKSALEREREERRQAKAALQQEQEWLASLGIDDRDELKTIVSTARAAKDKELLDKGELDKLIAQREEAATKRMREAHLKETEQLTSERAALKEKLHRELVVSKVMTGCAAHGVRKTAIADVLARASAVFKVGPEGDVQPLGPDGQILRGKTGEPLSFDEWFTDLQAAAEHLFEPNSGGGASNPAASGARPAGIPANIRRSQLTAKQKSELIDQMGQDEYLKLPL